MRRKDNVPLQNRLVKLIGNKPLFDCSLDGVETQVLLDSGSMVSLADEGWVEETFPSANVRPIADFLEDGEDVRFTAANNTEVPVSGCVVLDFSIGENSFPVPFLITKSELSNPIVGYNVIEHFIKTGQRGDVVSLLVDSIRDSDAGKVEVMVNLVSQDDEDDDFMGDLKAVKSCIIPPKSSMRVKCRVKGDVKGMDLSFLCSEPCIAEWDDDLIVTEAIGELKRGRTPHVVVELRNMSASEKYIKKNMIVGEICAVNAIHPIKLFNDPSELPDSENVDIAHVEVTGGVKSEEKWQPKAKLDHLSESERKEIELLLFEECEVFAKSDCDIGMIPELQMDIHLSDEVPVNQAYRHLPRKLYDDVRNYINDLIVNGWVRESSSPYASPIVCVRKKDSTLRLCVDYRKLNLKTIADRQPIPRVQDLLDGLHGQQFFSTLDMAKAYHQGFVSEKCRKYTAYSTPWQLFELLCIPFGLKNAPAAFQKFINQALSGLLDRICLAYLDDILIFGRTFSEHKENLRKVLKRLKSKGVKLRVEKCVFVKPEVRYLGRLVSADGYRADPQDVKALEKFRSAPKSVGDVRSLLGFLGYYRNYVKDFARKLKPVYDLLKVENPSTGVKKGYDKRKSVSWSSELQERVNGVIDTLQSPTVMAFPNFEAPFLLNTDASAVGLGAVLYQKQGDEKLNRVISYASRTLTAAEQNYFLHSGKLEFLALKWAIADKFSDYLGHGARFTVYTDNNPLTYVMTTAKLNATGMRWVSELAVYDFDIKYRPGKSNGDADGLSRNPCDDEMETLEQECIESCDKSVLTSILTSPVTAMCCAVSPELLKFPSAIEVEHSRMSLGDLQKRQVDDDVVGPVYQAVSLGNRPDRREWQTLSNRCKLLFRQWNKLSLVDGILVRKTSQTTQMILPESLHDMVFVELHQKMGHLGLERVLDLARRRFFWPHMGADIDHFIKKKCSCVISKKPNVPERAPLQPIHATRPFEMVSIDFLKVDKCKGGYEYILTVVDHFTRFAQAYATRKANGRAAADKIFNNFVLQFGFPSRIHHDRGKEFNNYMFQDLHRLAGIKSSNTTPYHPEGDGQCERLNRTLINMLKSIPENEKKNWKDHLQKLMFAYNSTINKTTQFSPFFLLFGREPRMPIDDVFPQLTSHPDFVEARNIEGNVDGSAGREMGTYVRVWNDRMNKAYDIANENIGKSGQYNKSKHDEKARCVDIVVGDRVVVKNVRPQGTTRTGKLASYWEPTVHEVVRQLKGVPVFVLREWGSKRAKTRILHRNLLKQVNELFPILNSESQAPNDDPPVEKVSCSRVPTIDPSPTIIEENKRSRSEKKSCKEKVFVDPSVVETDQYVNDFSDSDSDSDGVLVVCETFPVPSVSHFSVGERDVEQQILIPNETIPVVASSETSNAHSSSESETIPFGASSDTSNSHYSSSENLHLIPVGTPSETVDVLNDIGDIQLDAWEDEISQDEVEEGTLHSDVMADIISDASEADIESEGELENLESDIEDHSNDSFHSVASVPIESTTLDDSLDDYEDVPVPPRRSMRERKPAKRLVYDELGVGVFKSTFRITKPEKFKPKK